MSDYDMQIGGSLFDRLGQRRAEERRFEYVGSHWDGRLGAGMGGL